MRKARELDIDVVSAARKRITNVFDSGVKVYLSCSGGKDSIVMMDITYKLIQEGRINPAQLEAVFVDEECMYDDVIEIVKLWRKRFMMTGAKFTWFCMEYRQMNCLHSLENEETFVCWDRFQRENWCRPMPPFAITSHPLLTPREGVYQSFMETYTKDGMNLLGCRVSESIQRRKAIASTTSKENRTNKVYPIYDMKDSDIWLYIKEHGLEYPKVYEQMYACGLSRKHLRIANFFAVDSCTVLSKLYEFRPDLAEKVNRREPNAYIVQMYWDTEMFRRQTRRRRELEEGEDTKDYKALVCGILRDPAAHTSNAHAQRIIQDYKGQILRNMALITDKEWKKIYEALMLGDPKKRTMRALLASFVQNIVEDKL